MPITGNSPYKLGIGILLLNKNMHAKTINIPRNARELFPLTALSFKQRAQSAPANNSQIRPGAK